MSHIGSTNKGLRVQIALPVYTFTGLGAFELTMTMSATIT